MIHKLRVQLLYPIFLVPAFCFLLLACSKDEQDNAGQITGLWVQERVTEDGIEISLPSEQQNLSLLFESNGVYRTYAKDMPANRDHYGAWSISDNTWLEMTIDTWRISSSQWAKNHIPVRFTILTLSDNAFEIRIKTYVGEQKYAALFIETERPVITSENQEAISQEYKILKTYIFTFRKVTNLL